MKQLACIVLVGALVGISMSLDAQQASPDMILTNGKIITVDDRFSVAQAVAIRGGRIVAVGTNQDISRLAGPNTQRVDLRGKAMVPGFIDNHAHFQEEGAYWTLELRLDGVDSRKQALEMLRSKAKERGPGQWVYNLGGWSPDQFTDNKKPFTREELDQYAPANPVYMVFSRSEVYLNSKAIETVGLDKMNQPWIKRDAGGRPTGIVDIAGANAVRNAATFHDAPNGGRANLPIDVIVASLMAMLHELDKAVLTAAGCDYSAADQ